MSEKEFQPMLDAACRILDTQFSPVAVIGSVARQDAPAPNGQPFKTIETADRHRNPVEAIRELESKFRSYAIEQDGDTVWWRQRPYLHQDPVTKLWGARCRVLIGFNKDAVGANVKGNSG